MGGGVTMMIDYDLEDLMTRGDDDDHSTDERLTHLYLRLTFFQKSVSIIIGNTHIPSQCCYQSSLMTFPFGSLELPQ